MKKWLWGAVGLAFVGSIILGFSLLTGSDKDLEEYNTLIENTLSAYSTSLSFAQSNNEQMLNYVIKGESWGLHSGLEPLNNPDGYKVWLDKYFTSIGATGVREVIILVGAKDKVYIEVLWSDNEVLSIERRVITDESI